jgi:hypothetical protein
MMFPDGSKALLEPAALLDPWGQQFQYSFPGQHHTMTQKPDIWTNGPPGSAGIQIGNWDNRNQGQQ